MTFKQCMVLYNLIAKTRYPLTKDGETEKIVAEVRTVLKHRDDPKAAKAALDKLGENREYTIFGSDGAWAGDGIKSPTAFMKKLWAHSSKS